MYIACSALDPLLDDSVQFARRLKKLDKVLKEVLLACLHVNL